MKAFTDALALSLLLLICPFVFSQSEPQFDQHFCGTDEMAAAHYAVNPELKVQQERLDARIYELIQEGAYASAAERMTAVIPVVFHIIHQNGVENIPDDRVTDAIMFLNQAYGNLDPFNPDEGVAIDIQFCLAVQDTMGNLTDGINRIESPLTVYDRDVDDLTLKNLSRWDPTQYLNIWVVREINSTSSGPGVIGYATFPASHGNPQDGIVLESSFVGTSASEARVLVHETGHYLGLYHTFQGGCENGDCLADGDRVCDTPPDASVAVVGCGVSVNSCATDEDDLSTNNPFRPVVLGGMGDQPDMINNYMDYGSLSCWNAFTQGQSNRVNLSIMGARASLLTSLGCENPCTGTDIAAAFTPSAIVIDIDDTVNFNNTTTGATDYQWLIDGTPFSTDEDASFTFNTLGTFTITLVASNDEPNCTDEFDVQIEVVCPITASFDASSIDVQPGETIDFTNTTVGGVTYEWFIDGVLVSTDQNFSNTFNDVGGFIVWLVASNGTCPDTSNSQFISVGLCGSANRRANIWYFGTFAGLDFNGPSPVALLDGQLNQLEGCATMCDESGGLLFYTNGQDVWNRDHNIMPNGSGLLGDQSSTQSGVIVPRPNFEDRYYIFTVDDGAGPNGFRYSEVDMSLNGGLGDVVASTKNELILAQTPEKISATHHFNGTDIWVITHGWESNTFYAYLLTEDGLTLPPVESSVGILHGAAGGNYQGCLKASPTGDKLASSTNGDFGALELFDFDPKTGEVSNPITLQTGVPGYGVAFSPDGEKVYFTTVDSIDQYNLLAGSDLDIINSAIGVGFPFAGTSMQLAPDGKIYVSRTFMGHLGVINNPNALGLAANYVEEGFFLNGRTCQAGLPNFIQSYFRESLIFGPPAVCTSEEEVVYSVSDDDCATEVIWTYFGSGSTVPMGNEIGIVFSETGTDTLVVQRTGTCCFAKDTMIIQIDQSPSVSLGKDTALCAGIAITLDAGPGFVGYEWQDGSSDQSISASAPGAFWVIVENASGCQASDTISLLPLAEEGVVDLGDDVTVCEGAVVTLDAGEGFDTYSWSDGSQEQILSPELPGVYAVVVTDLCGNSDQDTVTIVWQIVPLELFDEELISCDGSSVVLDAGGSYVAYEWLDGTNGPLLQADTSGSYWVFATDSLGCTGIDTADVRIAEDGLEVSLGEDLEICDDSTFILQPSGGPYSSYLWQDGSTGAIFLAQSAGNYNITVTNELDCEAFDEIILFAKENCIDFTLQIPNVFTPNGDGSNQNFVIPGIEKADWSLTIYDRWGNEVYFNVNYQNNWDGGELSDGVYFYVLEAPTLQLSHSGYVHLFH